MDLEIQLYIAHMVNDYGPGLIGGIASLAYNFLVTSKIVTIPIVVVSLFLASLVGQLIVLFFITPFIPKFAILFNIPQPSIKDYVQAFGILGGFSSLLVIEKYNKYLPKYIDNQADKGLLK